MLVRVCLSHSLAQIAQNARVRGFLADYSPMSASQECYQFRDVSELLSSTFSISGRRFDRFASFTSPLRSNLIRPGVSALLNHIVRLTGRVHVRIELQGTPGPLAHRGRGQNPDLPFCLTTQFLHGSEETRGSKRKATQVRCGSAIPSSTASLPFAQVCYSLRDNGK